VFFLSQNGYLKEKGLEMGYSKTLKTSTHTIVIYVFGGV